MIRFTINGRKIQYDSEKLLMIGEKSYEVPDYIASDIKSFNSMSLNNGFVYINGYRFDHNTERFDKYQWNIKMLLVFVALYTIACLIVFAIN